MSPDEAACIAIERPLGQATGRVILWNMQDGQLSQPRYLTSDPADVRFPSLNGSGTLACWQSLDGGKWKLILWRSDGQERVLDIKPSMGDVAFGLVQPSLSPDGKFVAFVEDHEEPGGDKIDVFDLNSGLTVYFSGCGGGVMFPTLSDPPGRSGK
jgi:Tol biopolymer transport system component